MLPLLVSIPHGSAHIPDDILARMLASGEPEEELRRRILREGDPFTDEIFRIPGTRATINAGVSRFVVDLNRARDEGGENGVIKTTDFERRAFYAPGHVIGAEESEARLALYYDPYHRAVETALRAGHVNFFIDGHSM